MLTPSGMITNALWAWATITSSTTTLPIRSIDISQYRLLFGCSLLYMDRVPFELLDSAQLSYEGRAAWGGGGQLVFLNLTTII
jgi:hypothetical protein